MDRVTMTTSDFLWDTTAGRLHLAASSSKVLVIGSLNVDHLLDAPYKPNDDGSVTLNGVSILGGGHAANCAVALRKLGLEVTLVGAVGNDTAGTDLLRELAAEGIDVNLVRRVNADTGTAYIPVFPGERFMLLNRAANDLLTADCLDDIETADFHAVVVFDPPRVVVEELVRKLNASHGPEFRVWCPGGLHAGPNLSSIARDAFDLIVVNRDEFARMNETTDGTELRIALTKGESGSQIRIDGSWVDAPAMPVEARDETGAGDAWVAGIVLARLTALDLSEQLKIANVVGGLATQSVGARGSQPSLEDVVRFLYSLTHAREVGEEAEE